ncbi:VOC family protein [Xanthobacter sp.]|uniref:VOC family protein n=1 Tax=Xanthobacter sp. TaxID=35809 RepID=UPI0025D1D582|nr:VOC family protein [Xanthobacter sp.]
MTNKNNVLLYVSDAVASAAFYATLLGMEPVEASPSFAMFILPSGLGLGLWGRSGVTPAPIAAGGGCEVGFKVDTPAAVDETHAEWLARGAAIALPPIDLEFGRSFVALDPDGHRLRVYALSQEM